MVNLPIDNQSYGAEFFAGVNIYSANWISTKKNNI